MKKLAGQGVSIIWITHRLDEIFETADRVTLMREGKWITTKEIGQITMKEIVTELTGVTEEEQISTVNISNKTDEKLISCQNISAQKLFQNISFDLYRGEVLGITGLIGCGSTEIAKALFAVNKLSGGEIYIKGKKIEHFTPKTAAQKGIAYISEDRKMEGLNLKGSVQNNIVLTMSKEWSKLGFLNQKKEKESAKEMVETLDIRISDLSQTVNTLSGGNQQKIVLAKWLLKNAEVFVMCEPTRGIDIGAKREIHKIIRQLAKEGKAVLVVSSEVEEIIDTCDRVIILYDGRVKGELLSKDCAKKKMLDTMYGI